MSRNSKYEPLVDEVELIEANPQYAHIRLADGKESTVSIRDLAPRGAYHLPDPLPQSTTEQLSPLLNEHLPQSSTETLSQPVSTQQLLSQPIPATQLLPDANEPLPVDNYPEICVAEPPQAVR